MPIFVIPNGNGVVAQMVEQWTENPCVGSSILPDTTPKPCRMFSAGLFRNQIRSRSFESWIKSNTRSRGKSMCLGIYLRKPVKEIRKLSYRCVTR